MSSLVLGVLCCLPLLLAALVAVLSLDALGWRWVMGLGFGAVILVPVLAVALPPSIEQLGECPLELPVGRVLEKNRPCGCKPLVDRNVRLVSH